MKNKKMYFKLWMIIFACLVMLSFVAQPLYATFIEGDGSSSLDQEKTPIENSPTPETFNFAPAETLLPSIAPTLAIEAANFGTYGVDTTNFSSPTIGIDAFTQYYSNPVFSGLSADSALTNSLNSALATDPQAFFPAFSPEINPAGDYGPSSFAGQQEPNLPYYLRNAELYPLDSLVAPYAGPLDARARMCAALNIQPPEDNNIAYHMNGEHYQTLRGAINNLELRLGQLDQLQSPQARQNAFNEISQNVFDIERVFRPHFPPLEQQIDHLTDAYRRTAEALQLELPQLSLPDSGIVQTAIFGDELIFTSSRQPLRINQGDPVYAGSYDDFCGNTVLRNGQWVSPLLTRSATSYGIPITELVSQLQAGNAVLYRGPDGPQLWRRRE